MKKFINILFLLPNIAFAENNCATIRHVPDKELDLQQVINLGLCRNPQTAAAYASLQANKYIKNKSYSYYLPSVSMNSNVKRNHTEHDDWIYNASLSASYLIFDFGKRESDFKESLELYKAAGFDYNDSIQNYIYSVVNGYYALLTADANVKSAESALIVAQTAKNTADKKYKAGAVAKADVYQADTNLASSQLALERTKNNREITKANLLKFLSFPSTENIKIKDMPASFGSDIEMKNLDRLIEIAKKKRPELLKSKSETAVAWYKRNSAFLQNLPSFSVNGSFGVTDKTFGGMFNDMSIKADGHIGISVSMPIFSGFANMYNAKSAVSNYEKAKYMEQETQNSVMMDVFSAYQNYKTAVNVLEQTKTLLKSATESERVVSGMYKVGRATMLDWQTAQSDLTNAQKENNSAKYDLFIKRASVALAIGDIRRELKDYDNGK
ncbi:MAG: TolC family protein [Alphaproteobacteria bacterium]|nr:TolC family protein [Alphaproteobacteria bacterium]